MPLEAVRLQKPLRKLRKMLTRVPRRAAPAQVHHLRTRMRRIEAGLHALMLDCDRRGRKLLKALKPIRSRAGKVRDMDVLMGFASSLRPQGDEECLLQLLEYIGAERYRQARKLHRVVLRHGTQARPRLKRSAIYLGKVFHKLDKQWKGADVWSVEAMSLALLLARKLGQWPQLNAANLHAFRLKVKELRYVLQLADSPDSDFVAALGEVKDAIGEWHDWQQLGAIAKEVLHHGPGCAVITLLRSTTTEKFHHALSLADRMRRRYLKQPRRNPGRAPHLVVVPKPPVVMAASSLAA